MDRFIRDSGCFAAQVAVTDHYKEWAMDTLQGEFDDIAQGTLSRREVRNEARLVWGN